MIQRTTKKNSTSATKSTTKPAPTPAEAALDACTAGVLPPRTIGIDLSPRKSSYCVMGTDGKRGDEGTLAMDRGAVTEFFRAQPASRVVLEACTSARWVTDVAKAYGHEVVVANPRTFLPIATSCRKSDRNDARTLADFGQFRPHLLNPVALRSESAQSARSILIARNTLVTCRTALVNAVRSMMRESGFPLPDCAPERFHVRVRNLIPQDKLIALGPLLCTLEGAAKEIAKYDATIKHLGDEVFPQTKLLQQIAGVGPITALGFVVTVGDPSRFPRSRDVAAYFGLTPRSQASGDKTPQLSISKCGDTFMRRLLVGSASYILRQGSPDTDLKRWGLAIRARGGQASKAKARTAVARKLAVILHRLWVTGEVYRPLRESQPDAA